MAYREVKSVTVTHDLVIDLGSSPEASSQGVHSALFVEFGSLQWDHNPHTHTHTHTHSHTHTHTHTLTHTLTHTHTLSHTHSHTLTHTQLHPNSPQPPFAGPKLFKEPSSKSNKPLITNAIAHCCLAGKVNEGQKNVILEVRSPPATQQQGSGCLCSWSTRVSSVFLLCSVPFFPEVPFPW